MLKLPPPTRDDVVRARRRAGGRIAREGGKHTVLVHSANPEVLAVPRHRGNLREGLVRSLIRKAGLTVEEFLRLR
jgi:predicted RNA binding protein YcfA (HicA-like mRNA interferase family)